MRFFEKLWQWGKPSFRMETSDRDGSDISRALTPAKVDSIMRAANSGDTRDQCRLSLELLEHNADIAQAVQTRVAAVLGCHWSFEPGDDSDAAKAAAEQLTRELKAIDGTEDADNFDELLEDMMSALLPGFAISEILWKDGGHIAGFSSIEQKHFTLTDGFDPQLVTADYPRGFEIPRDRIVYHRMRFHGVDPARGGLIRPLAWLHCFNNGTEKNLLAFMERYGMPFLVVRVDDNTWKDQRHKIKELIRNFGSSGGGLFTKGTEHELLQAANSDGHIYFRMKDYLSNSINQLILGQTASSGDGGGLSKDGAQDKVRRDILESDCRRLMRTVNAQICVPWTKYNYGPDVAAPRFLLDCSAPEDKLATAQMVQTLYNAGFEFDADEMCERFGLTLAKREMPVQQSGGMFGMSDQSSSGKLSDAMEKFLGPVADRIAAELNDDKISDEEFSRRLGRICETRGDSSALEALMADDMRREYQDGTETAD